MNAKYINGVAWIVALGLFCAAAALASKEDGDRQLLTYVDRAPFYTGFESNLTDVFRVGAPLRAIVEASNPYDPNLIALYDGAHKVGYIPREHQQQVQALLTSNTRAMIRVVKIDPLHPWQGVKISVR